MMITPTLTKIFITNLNIQKMEKFEISAQTVQTVINYLAEKPYKEVADIINLIIKEVNENQKKEVVE